RPVLPQIQFVYLGPCVCLRLPSDPASRQAPLPLANGRRSPAPIPDFHRRDDAHAGRTNKAQRPKPSGFRGGVGTLSPDSLVPYPSPLRLLFAVLIPNGTYSGHRFARAVARGTSPR